MRYQFVVHLPVVHLCHLLSACSFTLQVPQETHMVYIFHHLTKGTEKQNRVFLQFLLELFINFWSFYLIVDMVYLRRLEATFCGILARQVCKCAKSVNGSASLAAELLSFSQPDLAVFIMLDVSDLTPKGFITLYLIKARKGGLVELGFRKHLFLTRWFHSWLRAL